MGLGADCDGLVDARSSADTAAETYQAMLRAPLVRQARSSLAPRPRAPEMNHVLEEGPRLGETLESGSGKLQRQKTASE